MALITRSCATNRPGLARMAAASSLWASFDNSPAKVGSVPRLGKADLITSSGRRSSTYASDCRSPHHQVWTDGARNSCPSNSLQSAGR
ncbi:MAG: hypothetical protein QM754_13075 [Tepidisphaeraceae bacterium]